VEGRFVEKCFSHRFSRGVVQNVSGKVFTECNVVDL
jgi:hypothetical protein